MEANQGKPTLESLAAAVDNAQSDYKRCADVLTDAQQRVNDASTALGNAKASLDEALTALRNAVTAGTGA